MPVLAAPRQTRCEVVIEEHVRIPGWVIDLESFRRWGDMDEFPEEGRIDYLQGEVWVDMSTEQVFSHNQVKEEFNRALGNLAKTERLGRYFPDGLRLTSISADLSVVPDGTFVLRKSRQSARVRLVEGARGGFVELEGIPDMVLEIVSTSSVTKDTDRLRDLYWQAGIREYWIVDARSETLIFDILRHAPGGYVATRKQAGWLKSVVLGKSFRLTVDADELCDPEYTLAVR